MMTCYHDMMTYIHYIHEGGRRSEVRSEERGVRSEGCGVGSA